MIAPEAEPDRHELPAHGGFERLSGSPNDPRRARRRRTLWIAAIAALVIVSAAGARATGLFETSQPAAAGGDSTTRTPASTTHVTRQTLSQTRTFQGTLGYGAPVTVTASTQGTVTRISTEGAAIARDSELYRVDEQPTVAIFGTIPSYRDLRPGDEGADVKQFETNLTALGYDGFDVDGTFTSATSKAVRKWQSDTGMKVTGTVGASSIAVVPEGSRIEAFHVRPGSGVAPGAAVVDVTGSAQVVTVDITTRDRDLFATGTAVSVRVPGASKSAKATVTSVTANPAGQGGGQESGSNEKAADATVEAALGENVDAGLLGAQVDVDVIISTHRDVLTVPVNALLALTSGGYGLEVVAGRNGTTEVVPVTTGLFASGRVEVTGVDEGATVGVAGR